MVKCFNFVKMASIAAVLLIVVGLGLAINQFVFNDTTESTTIAMNEEIETDAMGLREQSTHWSGLAAAT